jgi:hypothetical protein
MYDTDEKIREALNVLKNPDDDLDAAVGDARKRTNELAAAAKRGDQKKVDELSTTLPQLTDRIAKQANATGSGSDQPAYKKKLNDAADELQKAVADDIAAAKKTVANPNDQKNQNELNKATDAVSNALDKVRTVQNDSPKHIYEHLPPHLNISTFFSHLIVLFIQLGEPELVDIARHEKDLEDRVDRAVKGNDAARVSQEGKNLVQQQDRLASEAKKPSALNPALQKQGK